MRVRIRDFKSVGFADVELAPLTLLLGPPASGKSNVLDALALVGYFNRFVVLQEEYGDNASNLEPLTLISRFNEYVQLFRYHDLTRKVGVEVEGIAGELKLEIYFRKGGLNVAFNGVKIPWDLRSLRSDPMHDVRNALRQAAGDGLVEARLYGYDRYGLASSVCQSPVNCGFHMHLRGVQVRPLPRHVMSEFGWNAHMLTKSVSDVILHLNSVLMENLGEKVEVKVLRSGAVMVFDYDVEIDAVAVSDSIFRTLYYLMALRTAANYVKLHGLEGRFILLLEEPEAHVFPFFLNLLTDYVVRVSKVVSVVVATHNPILVSMLWDHARNVKTYYTVRDAEGSTSVAEIDVGRLAEDLRTAEEVLFMPPKEVLEKYAVKRVEASEK